jgi:nucleoside-diphosphate-sugar epimerase
MAMTALVIGGTGPTGPFVVNGLIERGHAVVICHTGAHEIDEIPSSVEHIHTDPFDSEALSGALGNRTFDLVVGMYGRLRSIAEIMAGRAGRLITVGGMPALRGYMDPVAGGRRVCPCRPARTHRG